MTGDVSQYTKAKIMQPGASCDVLARFSTVAGEQGSPDTWRDPRGFSPKFYTEDGNWYMVGNNTRRPRIQRRRRVRPHRRPAPRTCPG